MNEQIPETSVSINSINTMVRDDSIIVTMVIAGEPKAWIEYNVEQVDGLIDLLTNARNELVKASKKES